MRSWAAPQTVPRLAGRPRTSTAGVVASRSLRGCSITEHADAHVERAVRIEDPALVDPRAVQPQSRLAGDRIDTPLLISVAHGLTREDGHPMLDLCRVGRLLRRGRHVDALPGARRDRGVEHDHGDLRSYSDVL